MSNEKGFWKWLFSSWENLLMVDFQLIFVKLLKT